MVAGSAMCGAGTSWLRRVDAGAKNRTSIPEGPPSLPKKNPQRIQLRPPLSIRPVDDGPSVGARSRRRQRLLVARRSIFTVHRVPHPYSDAATLAAVLVDRGMPAHASPASDVVVVQQTGPREPSHANRPLLRMRLRSGRQHQLHLSRMRYAYSNNSKSNRGRMRSWDRVSPPMRVFTRSIAKAD